MRMASELVDRKLSFSFSLIDIREYDSESLLESPWVSDNVMAILARMQDRRETVRRILQRIAQFSGSARALAFQQLSILSGLRHLGSDIKEEIKRMPILTSMLDHDLLGPALRQGLEQGLEQGEINGMRSLLRHQIEKRFGVLSPALEVKFLQLKPAELDAAALRLLDAATMDELFADHP